MILLIPAAIGLVWLVQQIRSSDRRSSRPLRRLADLSAPLIEWCGETDCGCRWGSLDHRQ